MHTGQCQPRAVPTPSWHRHRPTACPSSPAARCSPGSTAATPRSFQSISRGGTTLSFTIDAGAGANGLRAMLPVLVGRKPPGITDSGREPGDVHDGDHQGHRVRLVPSCRWRVLGGLPARHDRPRHLERDCSGRARWNRHRDVVDQRALGLPHRVRHDPRSARPQRDGSIPGHLPQHAAFRAQPEHDVSLPGHVSRRGNELIDATGTAGTAGQFRRAVGRFHRHHYVRLLGRHDRYGHLRVGVGQR